MAIIGAGILGLSAAWAFANSGRQVVVYEAESVGSGASGGLIGALSPHMPEKWNAKKAFQFEALLMAAAFWAEIEHVSGLSTGYGRIGRLLPLRAARQRELAEVRKDQAADLWQGKAKWTVVDEMPDCAPSPFGFVHETLSARLQPRLALAALAQALRLRGVEIVEHHRVARDNLPDAGLQVIACGSAAADLTPDLPTGFWSTVKGQSALVDAVLPASMPLVFQDGTYVVPHGAAGTAVGSTSEKEWSEATAIDDKLDPLVARATELVPTLEDAQVVQTWAGLRSRARLPDPVIGLLPGSKSTWLLGGGFKIGLGIGPHLGETLAQLVDGHDVDLPESFTLTHQLSRD